MHMQCIEQLTIVGMLQSQPGTTTNVQYDTTWEVSPGPVEVFPLLAFVKHGIKHSIECVPYM